MTARSVFDRLDDARARDRAARAAEADRADDEGDELAEWDYGEFCPSCRARTGVCGPPDSPYCDDRWHQ